MVRKIISYKDKDENLGYHFHCPGCNSVHSVFTERVTPGQKWGFNGNEEKPTFTPSVFVRFDHLSEMAMQRNREFYKIHKRFMTIKELPYDVKKICHSFVTNGMIRFLDDSTHHLKGQTVELDDF